jgi:WD40 repeat protein
MIGTAAHHAPHTSAGRRPGNGIAALCTTALGTIPLGSTAPGTAAGRTGQTILVSGGDRVQSWDPATGTATGRPLTGHAGCVTTLTVMPGDGVSTVLVSGADDGTVRVWNLEAGTPARTFTAAAGLGVRAVCSLENVHGRPLLAAAAGPAIQVWDPRDDEPLAVLDGPRGVVTALCPVWPGAAATGRVVLASGTDDGTIRIWNTSTWRILGELPGAAGAVRSLCTVAAGPTGPILAAAGDDGTIRLWNPLSATAGPVLAGHTGPVTALCTLTTPAGSVLLASGGADGTVRLWDPHTGRPVGTALIGHRDAVTALCESPDSRGASRLASADGTGWIRFWDPYAGIELTANAIPAG